MLQAGGAVAALGLHHLVRLPDGGGLEHGHVLACPAQQQLVPTLDAVNLVEVEDHGHAKQLLAFPQAHVLHHGVVGSLLHEAGQGAESPTEQAEDVAGLALVQLQRLHRARSQSLGRGRVAQQIHQLAAMRRSRRRAHVAAPPASKGLSRTWPQVELPWGGKAQGLGGALGGEVAQRQSCQGLAGRLPEESCWGHHPVVA
mmetsp:Transcript_57062/g.102553  ORF Transcript_57062/g.102553 Transcript_57062/m.102553 type:complete len:200 (-) Transcript_57062:61-660(-)